MRKMVVIVIVIVIVGLSSVSVLIPSEFAATSRERKRFSNSIIHNRLVLQNLLQLLTARR